MARRTSLAACLPLLACVGVACAQTGPDVIVGDLPSTQYFGTVGGIHAYSLATTSCNVGTAQLLWIQNSNQHPVIAQNMYRLSNGRFEQVGQSWLKHGFCALQGTLCSACQPAGGGCVDRLGVGCSDPYSAGLNGEQGNLGPRHEVNASTGVFTWPFTTRNQTGNAIYKRLQVAETDLTTPGAQYFVEGQYVAQDDATAGNNANNASYRRAVVNANFSLSLQGQTVREDAAIYAWRAHGNGPNSPDNNVEIVAADVPGDGRFHVGARVFDNGDGTYRYEYAVHNLSSHRSGAGLSIPIPAGVEIFESGFHDVPSHSGAPYSNADWAFSNDGSAVSWTVTETFAQNPNANALRWGTMYNFWIVTNAAPDTGSATLSLFRTGSPGSVAAAVSVPTHVTSIAMRLVEVVEPPAFIPPGQGTDLSVGVVVGDDEIVPGSPLLRYRFDGGQWVDVPLVARGTDMYDATLPAASCDDLPEFFFQIEGAESGIVTLPPGGELSPYSAVVGVVDQPFADDFETDQGWQGGVAGDTATTGQWVRVNPNGTSAQPEDDVTPDGTLCWVTGNAPAGSGDGTADVDGGFTTLLSPVIDLSSAPTATIGYWRWYSNSAGAAPNADVFVIDVSNNDGATWTNVETVGPTGPETSGGWVYHEFEVADFVAPTSTVRMRFIASDLGDGSLVEAAVDDFTVTTFACDDVPTCPCDWNGDGGLNTADFFEFFAAFFGTPPDADYNNDGSTDTADFFEFFSCFFAAPAECQ